MENVARFDALSAFAICKEQRTLPRICRGGDAKKVTAIEGKSSAMEISAHIRYVLRRCTGGILLSRKKVMYKSSFEILFPVENVPTISLPFA